MPQHDTLDAGVPPQPAGPSAPAESEPGAAYRGDDRPAACTEPWSVAQSRSLYGIEAWGRDYFSINDHGHVAVHPTGDPAQSIDLKTLVDELRQRDLEPPLLIRFSDILQHRLKRIADAFGCAIREMGYQGRYACVYPVKVNQQRHVVEEVLRFGREHGFGLEAGSKPELLALMALVDDETTPIICNGFKDDQFIEAVILATQMGKHIIPVVEKFSELKLIVKYAKRHKVRPRIGVRVKLSARGAGRWEQSGGVRSKFGLFVSEVLQAVAYLREADMLGCLTLVHFHLGSQINNIRSVKSAIVEQARVYAELRQAGAELSYIDVGGGLGVDYDGSKSTSGSSANYSLQEYANDVVYHIKNVCDDTGVPHPTILSESGRAMVAHHSMLVFDVLGWSGFDRFELPDSLTEAQQAELPIPVRTLYEAYAGFEAASYVECYHDAAAARDETLNLFNLGYCSLEHRALAERLFYGVCVRVLRIVRRLPQVPEEFTDLELMLSDTYFCNLSIFQSLPDSWAIDQLFPIMPIHRLGEKPTCRGVLADITCDSDGKIDHFIGERAPKGVLEMHPYVGEPYYLGAFLVGAYQEILGDLHNLLGDTNAVHVRLDGRGEAVVEEVVEGDTVREVLGYVQFDADELRRQFRRSVERAVQDRKMSLESAQVLRRFYDQGLNGYTYLT